MLVESCRETVMAEPLCNRHGDVLKVLGICGEVSAVHFGL